METSTVHHSRNIRSLILIRNRSNRILLVVGLFVVMMVPSSAFGEQPIEALQKGVDESLRVLQDPKLKAADRKDVQQHELWLIVQRLFDFKEFSRRVLGSNWKNFTPAQREEFVRIFAEFLGEFYLGKLQEKYKGETVTYVRQNLRTPNRALVNIRVVWQGRGIPVDLGMLKREGLWKVYDIQVLGISAVRNYRAQFKWILKKETPAQVIDRLRQKIEQIDQQQPEG
jgi:phospholipid transport system substrate-binding protein